MLQVQRLCLGRGMGVPVRAQGSAPEPFGPTPIPWEMPPHAGMELGCSSRTEPPEEGVGSPSLCFALYSLFLGYGLAEARLLGLRLPGSGPGGSCRFVSRDAAHPTRAGARMPSLGCGRCRAGRAKPFAAPAHPNPRFAGVLRKNAFFVVVVEHKDSKDCSAGLSGRGTWGSPALPPHECLWFLRDLN